MQPAQSIHILLVEDNPGDVLLLREALADDTSLQFELIHADRPSRALQQLDHTPFDVVLLDLSLPDSYGMDTFFGLQAHYSHVPIVVLTSLADEELALRVVGSGGQDYLIKGQIDSTTLTRAIRYAIERHRVQRDLRTLSLTDDVTGLQNRRGFFARAIQQIKLSNRRHTPFLVVYADVDGLKRVNDTLGHNIGSQLLIDAAQILTATFRETDIVSRFGGDEFVVLVIDAEPDAGVGVAGRLEANILDHNRHAQRPYSLALSVGMVPFEPDGGTTLEAAIANADQAMYLQKQTRQHVREV